MRILVTGATGYLGRHVVNHLLAADHSVTALIRKPKQKKIFDSTNCEFAIGDITDPDSMLAAAAGQEAIVHSAALVQATDPEDFTKINVDGTRNVVQAANKQQIQHLVLLSSVGLYGGPDEGSVRDETTIPHPENAYARSKLKAESITRDELEGNIKLTILRPTGFYGPARPLYIALVKSWQKKPVIFSLRGDEIVQPCHIMDVCNVIERALAIPPEQHRVLVVAGERALGLRELYAELAKHMAIHLRFIIIPAWLAIPGIRLLTYLGKIPAARSELLLLKARGHSPGARYNTTKTESELNISWVPVTEGLRDMAKSL